MSDHCWPIVSHAQSLCNRLRHEVDTGSQIRQGVAEPACKDRTIRNETTWIEELLSGLICNDSTDVLSNVHSLWLLFADLRQHYGSDVPCHQISFISFPVAAQNFL